MLLNTAAAALDGFIHSQILLISSDSETTLYRDEVLRRAGFAVTILSTAKTSAITDAALGRFSAVVLCDTVASEELYIISARVRRNNPWA